MKQITEEMGIHKEWYAEAPTVTIEKLPEFLNHLLNDYEHDYGTICHAIIAGAIATMWAMNNHPQGGITGFQASCIIWGVVRQWSYRHNKCGLKIIDYDKFLYPQYQHYFEKTITPDTWESIQQQARVMLSDKNSMMHHDVKKHLESIVEGVIPFGYTISNE